VVPTEPELTGVLLEERYRVGELLAIGGMSRVYRGTDLRLEREVAIKVMDSRLAADPSFRGRFEREARAIARIDHPGVVDVYDQGEHGEPPDPVVFLVMELIRGGTLRDVLGERGALPVPEALAVLEPVLSALAAAHAQGMTHRDVKPENVLISTAGAVKVADFGLVTAAAQAGASTAGMIMGTVAYLSPEQVTGRAVDARSDVYSAGVVLYELLTGVPPYDGEHALSVAYQHVNQDVPAPSTRVPGVPPDLDALVISATRRDPEARPPSAEVLLHAVRGVRASLGIPRVPVPVPGGPPAPRTAPSGAPGQTLGPRHAAPVGAAPRSFAPPGGLPAGPAHAAEGASTVPGHAPPGHRPTRAMTSASAASRFQHGPAEAWAGAEAGSPSAWTSDADLPDYVAQRRRGRRILAIWIAAVLLLALLIGALAWGAGVGQWSSTPAVIGLDQASAERLINEAGLVPSVRTAPNDTASAGTVYEAVPGPSSRVRKGSTVTLSVSTGRPRVPAVPPGTAVPDAERMLRDAGLAPREDAADYASHPTAPRGTVIGTSPAAGTSLPVSSPVTLILSSGPPTPRRPRDDPGSFAELLQRQLERALRGDGPGG